MKPLDPRVQKLIRTHLDVFGELPPLASCDKLVQMDLKLKPEFVGHKIRRRRTKLRKSRRMRLSVRYKNVLTLAWSWSTRMGTTPHIAGPVSWRLRLGLQPNGSWRTMES